MGFRSILPNGLEGERGRMKQKQNQTMQQEMPYEKFLRFGPENLTEGELLAIILRTGTKEKPALELAKEVLALGKYPRTGLLGLHDLSLEELKKVKGIGEVKAVKLKSITELAVRISRAVAKNGLNIKEPETIAKYYMEKLRHRKAECVYLLCLDTKGLILEEKKLSEGSINISVTCPRDIFLTALKAEAVNIILIHNHPSGDPSPGGIDLEITARIARMGIELGIPLLDHVIIGDNVYYSFRENGKLGHSD